MPMDERSHTNRSRAESFGAGAEAYDQARPSYPSALIDDLVAAHPTDALDVGCGTGKAARLLAERGVAVMGVEIDDRMADVARAHGIAVETSGFEAWDAAGRRFDLVVCGQAWHWIDPDAGAAKVAQLLRFRGLLGVFWNFAELAPDAQRALDGVYLRVAPSLTKHSVMRGGGAETVPPHLDALRATGHFDTVEYREYQWRTAYTTEQWIALARSHSDHSTLPSGQLDELMAQAAKAIDSLGGVLPVRYRTHAILAGLAA
jgi:SAM-dependent methyltransferase